MHASIPIVYLKITCIYQQSFLPSGILAHHMLAMRWNDSAYTNNSINASSNIISSPYLLEKKFLEAIFACWGK
ncbi:hypothetical protein OIU74_028687 [Salix koriyanagi]|uniref:Uncharacterized protein n=1 Tax=Salix koriyanagi TaxID=2511006 RepID=A0A9Q0VD54_9ROSI|nr:hypothetical protein OIU74_028687 [Salix koriyanagi]